MRFLPSMAAADLFEEASEFGDEDVETVVVVAVPAVLSTCISLDVDHEQGCCLASHCFTASLTWLCPLLTVAGE